METNPQSSTFSQGAVGLNINIEINNIYLLREKSKYKKMSLTIFLM